METSAAGTELKAPFYQRASFWLGPFTWGLGLLVAIGLAIGWYVLGGFPRDHDKYGEVTVPGQAVLQLPSGDVRLYFENHATHTGSSTNLDDRPPGLKVQVSGLDGGAPLKVSDVPSWIFSSTSGSRGHEPYGKIDVPSAGAYVVATGDDQSGGIKPLPTGAGAATKPPVAQAPVASPPPKVDEGPAISVGQSPWTPLDSKLLGSILVFVVVMLIALALTLPFRFVMRDR
jgi:hypothetical protein